MLGRRQARDLLAWAGESGRLIASAVYRPRLEDGGQEHRVWLDEASQRYFKATFPARFGFTVIALPELGLELAPATPLEYVERWLLQNPVFGDDVQLERVAEEDGGLVTLISQPNLTGGEATLEEIERFMNHLWFQPLGRLGLGGPCALGFFRDLDEVAAFDAHAGNFVKDQDGVILPIDLILVRADAAMQAALTGAMSAG